MANGTLTFLGKWTFTQSDGAVQAAPSGSGLVVGPSPSDGSDRFNAYGTAASFVLQSNVGAYVVAANGGYAATATDPSTADRFTLADDGSGDIHVVDLGTDPTTPASDLWNNADGTVKPVAPGSPPRTASFTKTEITPSLATILRSGFTSSRPDLTWVDFADVDFTGAALLDFTQSTLDDADFSGARFPSGIAFDKSTAAGADFSKAVLASCQFGGVDFKGGARRASFAGAQMSNIDLNHADLTGADLANADMSKAANLANAVFDGADLTGATLRGCLNIYETSLVGATLVGVDFSGSSVTGAMDISGANLTGATLCNPQGSTTIFPGNLVISSSTNFREADLRYLDLHGYDLSNVSFARADLTGCKLDSTKLDNADFGFATLTGVTITGGVSMHGTNLSSASLQGADLSAAQLGAVGQLFRVGDDQSDYADFLTAVRNGDPAAVSRVFASNGVALSGTVVVRTSPFSATAWQVQTAEATYRVVQETIGSTKSLVVYQPTSAAVLANAFMVDVNLKGANMNGVRASGAQLYATAGNSVNLNKAKLNGLQVNNANLGNIDLSQANLAGVNFDYAMLTGADFTGASISTDADGGQPSFNGANLQGAKFDSAQLHDVIFSNAAVAVADPNDASAAAGVWLFSLDAQQASLVTPQLDVASLPLGSASTGAKHVFTIPTGVLPQMQTTGPAPTGVVTAFKNAGITLAQGAVLVVFTTDLFWKLVDGSTAYSIFPSVNTDYQPALGVASGRAYTVGADFWIPLSLASELGNGPVSDAVVKAFSDADVSISTSATLNTAQYPLVWQIISGTDTYTAWLMFDSTVIGVDTSIVVRAGIPNVISVFGGHSIALSAKASVTRLSKGGWQIDNDAENPFNQARGYIEFKAFNRSDGGLDVYGSLIRIVRSSAPGVEEYVNVPCDVTTLSTSVLGGAGNTVCPNGATVSANQRDQLPFDQWLWARYLPSPPRCVPDPQGKFFCPT